MFLTFSLFLSFLFAEKLGRLSANRRACRTRVHSRFVAFHLKSELSRSVPSMHSRSKCRAHDCFAVLGCRKIECQRGCGRAERSYFVRRKAKVGRVNLWLFSGRWLFFSQTVFDVYYTSADDIPIVSGPSPRQRRIIVICFGFLVDHTGTSSPLQMSFIRPSERGEFKECNT